jgi:hypothetical protein
MKHDHLEQPHPMSEDEAQAYAIRVTARAHELNTEDLYIIPDAAGWIVKDRLTKEKYEVPAKLQKELGHPRVRQ